MACECQMLIGDNSKRRTDRNFSDLYVASKETLSDHVKCIAHQIPLLSNEEMLGRVVTPQV